VVRLTNQFGIEMPICEAVEAVLHRDASVEAIIDGLLRRPYRSE
jgi:glycerol-3-phosphate dehydrogenase (NAD(P)+)